MIDVETLFYTQTVHYRVSEQEVSIRCLFRTVRCLCLNADLTKGGMIAINRQLYGSLAKDGRVNEKFPSQSCRLSQIFSSPRLTQYPDKPVFSQYACAGPHVLCYV
jgi:hypothetical protein